MKREIKFRGKCKITGNWMFGYYYEYSGKHVICNQNHSDNATTDHWGEVISETVGQFTGIKDKNGKEIYEGDVVKDADITYVVNLGEYLQDDSMHNGFYIECPTNEIYKGGFSSEDSSVIKLVGNIHDNSELLK